MKVVILAGGFGSRLSEETNLVPKPMVCLDEKPILWHIMKYYSSYGFNDFIILLGYKGDYIKNYFAQYHLLNSSFSVSLKNSSINIIDTPDEDWNVTLLDTGINSMTGYRILQAKDLIGEEQFLLTYGDGVADIDLNQLINTHNKSPYEITMSAVQPAGRFGALNLKGNMVTKFEEKADNELSWVNGGYFICENSVFDFIDDNPLCVFEEKPLQELAKKSKLGVYKHNGFWKCMDTLKDRNDLTKLIKNKEAKWVIW